MKFQPNARLRRSLRETGNMRLASLAIAVSALSAADYTYYLSGSSADATPATQGGYLLMGGGRDDPRAFRWFLQRGGWGDVVILRASGSDGYHQFLAEIGPVDSVESIVFRNEAAARDPFVLDRIRRADALFLAGGDQWNYVRFWRNTPVAEAIEAAARRGVPIGGTSAGLAVLGQFAFSAEHDGVTSGEAQRDPMQPKVALTRDFLRLPGLECLITDSHFTERSRQGRLRVFLQRLAGTCPSLLGVGIDERTSLLVEPGGDGEVVGAGGVHFYRLRDGTIDFRSRRAGEKDSLRR
jgi:cyanophycinase